MAADPENTLIMTLESGPVTIQLRPELAPGHVGRIKELAREGFYDGVVFHRVIPGTQSHVGIFPRTPCAGRLLDGAEL
jgi:peptidylprolyl isomerase